MWCKVLSPYIRKKWTITDKLSWKGCTVAVPWNPINAEYSLDWQLNYSKYYRLLFNSQTNSQTYCRKTWINFNIIAFNRNHALMVSARSVTLHYKHGWVYRMVHHTLWRQNSNGYKLQETDVWCMVNHTIHLPMHGHHTLISDHWFHVRGIALPMSQNLFLQTAAIDLSYKSLYYIHNKWYKSSLVKTISCKWLIRSRIKM